MKMPAVLWMRLSYDSTAASLFTMMRAQLPLAIQLAIVRRAWPVSIAFVVPPGLVLFGVAISQVAHPDSRV
jgi:hypothetical protein